MMERIIQTAVITGPTGAIGIALCRMLAEMGVTVYAVCHPNSLRINAIPVHEQIHLIKCDIHELSTLPELLSDGADAFFHFAWMNTIGPGRNDTLSQIENIRCTIDAVRCAKALGCQVFLGAGSQAEYGRVDSDLMSETPCAPENGYGIAKLCAGQMSRIEACQLGIDHIWTRILSVYGPGDGPTTMISSVIRQLLRREKPALTAGVQVWDYLYSEDAARAFLLMATRGVSGRVYPLGSGQAYPLRRYIEILRDTIDPNLPLGFGEIPYDPLQVMHLKADISVLTQDTGYVPVIPFEIGIAKTIDEWKGSMPEYGRKEKNHFHNDSYV